LFISHEGHGNSGIIEVNEEILTVKTLNKALKEANEKKLFKELVFYVVACHGGSLFDKQLDESGNSKLTSGHHLKSYLFQSMLLPPLTQL
jgi:glycosylphosphatidylinositol transamidase (GPIT) subunit GPI8